jgi:hypothetical protein
MSKKKIKFVPNKQKVDLSLIDDPLAKDEADLVNQRVDVLVEQNYCNKKYKNIIEFYKTNNITFPADEIPRSEWLTLRELLIPEMVQRLLDGNHMCNIASKFDPRLMSPIFGVRISGSNDIQVFDSMHTLVTIATFVKEGLITVRNEKTGQYEPVEDFLGFKVECWVINTDTPSFPAIAALYRNGEGSKPWGPYDFHRVFVRSYKFYNIPGPNGEYKLAAEKHDLMIKNNMVPLPKGHPDLGMLGTFGHIESIFKYRWAEMDELKFILETNNKYWKGDNDASMFGFYGNLFQGYKTLGQPTSGKKFNDFLNELHAIIKTFFVSMPELKAVTTEAYNAWKQKQGKQKGTPPNNCALAIVLKIYQRLGGKHPVLSEANDYVYSPSSNVKIDIYDSLPLSLRQDVQNSTL